MPQEAPFQDLRRQIKDSARVEFKRLELNDTTDFPAFPSPPLVDNFPSRLEFATVFDYAVNYTEQEARLIFSPFFADRITGWLNQCFPIPRERIVELLALISTDDPRFQFVVNRAQTIKAELEEAIKICNLPNVPLVAKLALRTNLLAAIASLAAHMARTLYEVWEGTKCGGT